MATAGPIWSAVIEPGKKTTIVPVADVKVTNVALSDTLEDPEGRTTLKLTFDTPVETPEDGEEDFEGGEKKTVVLCSLTGGKIEQALTNIVLLEDDTYTFETTGKNAIHLLGNYIDQSSDEPGFPMSDDSDSDLDEEAFDLRDVSSDVEMEADPAELDSDASRFEEVDDETEDKPKSLKRPRESTEGSAKESKAEKKAKKKAKAADGTAVPVSDTPKPASEKKDASKKPESEKKEKKPAGQEKVIAGGLKIVDAKVGTGPQAKKGNTVRMRYIGKLQNGKVFDQNTKGKPFTFHLGKGEVIKGWDEGIVGMQAGGERVLTIPSDMAYGKRGSGKEIPPNSTLTFEVKLLEIK